MNYFDKTLTGLTKEQSNANCKQNQERYIAFSAQNPVTLEQFLHQITQEQFLHQITLKQCLTFERSFTAVLFHKFEYRRLVDYSTNYALICLWTHVNGLTYKMCEIPFRSHEILNYKIASTNLFHFGRDCQTKLYKVAIRPLMEGL